MALSLYRGDDGHLRYQKISMKYAFIAQAYGEIYNNITGAEDILSENGLAYVKNNEIVIAPALEIKTIQDHIISDLGYKSIDEWFAYVKKTGQLKYETLDMLYAANTEIGQTFVGDGVVLDSGGVLDVGENIGDDSGTRMMTIFDRVMADKTLCSAISQVRIGGVLMDVQWTKPSSEAIDPARQFDLIVDRITANGHTVKIGAVLPVHYRIDLFEFDNGSVCVKIDANGAVNKNDTMWNTWIFLKDEAFLLKPDQSAVPEYNREVMTFYKGDDGQLWYKAVPNKEPLNKANIFNPSTVNTKSKGKIPIYGHKFPCY